MVDQRDTADISYPKVEPITDSEGVPAQENNALPSSQTSLSGLAPSERSKQAKKIEIWCRKERLSLIHI